MTFTDIAVALTIGISAAAATASLSHSAYAWWSNFKDLRNGR